MIIVFFALRNQKRQFEILCSTQCFKKIDSNNEVQVEASEETHIDYLMGEYETNGNDFFLIHLI